MKLKIVTASKQLLEVDEIAQVNVPGIEGVLGILPGHVNIISPMQIGQLEYKDKEGSHFVAINGGFAQVFNDEVFIMADEAEMAHELVDEEIEHAIKLAEDRLTSELEPTELIQLEKQLRYEKMKKMARDNHLG